MRAFYGPISIMLTFLEKIVIEQNLQDFLSVWRSRIMFGSLAAKKVQTQKEDNQLKVKVEVVDKIALPL